MVFEPDDEPVDEREYEPPDEPEYELWLSELRGGVLGTYAGGLLS